MGKTEVMTETLHGVFKSYHRIFDTSYADMWIKALGRFEENIFKRVCEKWVTQQAKPPFLNQLVENCQSLQDYYRQSAAPSITEAVCRYRSDGESQLSRDLCDKVTPADAQASRAQGWGPFCSWHNACAYAKAFPDSTAADMVKTTLLVRKEATSSPAAENELFLRTWGWNPYDTDPRKKDNAAMIRQAMSGIVKNMPKSLP